jgi:hypothetical protein
MCIFTLCKIFGTRLSHKWKSMCVVDFLIRGYLGYGSVAVKALCCKPGGRWFET